MVDKLVAEDMVVDTPADAEVEPELHIAEDKAALVHTEAEQLLHSVED